MSRSSLWHRGLGITMPRYVLLINAALLSVVLAQQASVNDEDMFQRPISMPNPFDVDDARNKTRPSKPNVRGPGQACKDTSQCPPDYCCLRQRRRGRRICLPRAGRYQRCSEDQVKGGYYMYHCPCLMGKHTCERGFCIP
uniref:Putative ixodegrins large 4 n=1 Tax=Amblyomma cajennense TaxID=34607 RepID=A0A023FBZ2_AMBCJ